jgi:hypothetical protein
VWTAWARGRPVTTTALADAVDTLHQNVRPRPVVSGETDIDQTQWTDLLEPAVELLLNRGLDVRPRPEHGLDQDLDVGIEL